MCFYMFSSRKDNNLSETTQTKNPFYNALTDNSCNMELEIPFCNLYVTFYRTLSYIYFMDAMRL